MPGEYNMDINIVKVTPELGAVYVKHQPFPPVGPVNEITLQFQIIDGFATFKLNEETLYDLVDLIRTRLSK